MEATTQDLISIIVPVYNVHQYLQTCVQSVINQTYATWELILVDDGSTDGSIEDCQSWASRDERIQVLCNQHGGPAKARNTGIAAAKGDYIYFMDSDDWIEPDMLEVLLKAMNNADADVAGCGVFFDYPTRTKVVTYTKTDTVLSREQALNYIITGKLPSYLCLLLWRRSVIQEPYADIPCYEDYATGYKWFSHARRVVMLATPKYHYIQREGSILHTSRRDEFLLDIHRERHEYIREHQLMNDDANRANTVRNLLKLAKDFSRKPLSTEERLTFVARIREALPVYLPVPFSRLGLKRWLRLQLLMRSIKLFVQYV